MLYGFSSCRSKRLSGCRPPSVQVDGKEVRNPYRVKIENLSQMKDLFTKFERKLRVLSIGNATPGASGTGLSNSGLRTATHPSAINPSLTPPEHDDNFIDLTQEVCFAYMVLFAS